MAVGRTSILKDRRSHTDWGPIACSIMIPPRFLDHNPKGPSVSYLRAFGNALAEGSEGKHFLNRVVPQISLSERGCLYMP